MFKKSLTRKLSEDQEAAALEMLKPLEHLDIYEDLANRLHMSNPFEVPDYQQALRSGIVKVLPKTVDVYMHASKKSAKSVTNTGYRMWLLELTDGSYLAFTPPSVCFETDEEEFSLYQLGRRLLPTNVVRGIEIEAGYQSELRYVYGITITHYEPTN